VTSGSKGAASGKSDTEDRPGASGHRFGPDLACSECGISWDVHQRQPKPCKTDVPVDAFARRPAPDLPESAAAGANGLADAPDASSHASQIPESDAAREPNGDD